MKFGFKFSNLCGTVYKGGNLCFSADGRSVLSPVGNRVSVFNLVENTSYTLPFENRKDVSRIAVSPDGNLLVSVDLDGRALVINLKRRALLHHFSFKAPVHGISFSPNGEFLAVTHKRQVHVWKTPGRQKEFAPFHLHRRYTGHFDSVTCVAWSDDSRFFVTGSRDCTCRVYSTNPIPGYKPVALTAHRDRIISVYFAKDSLDIYTVSYDGTLLHWHSNVEESKPDDEPPTKRARVEGAERSSAEDSEGESDTSGSESEEGGPSSDSDSEDTSPPTLRFKWYLRSEDKHYFLQDHAKVICTGFHKESQVLVAGFSNGVFGLYEMPDFNNIHTLSISQKKITTVAVDPTGEWLAFGSSKLGQLLVWEWKSETHVLKQQGHFYDMNVLSYAPDGRTIATGGDDGKVKLWNTSSGFCVKTFSEHTGGITGLRFIQSGLAVVSASLDGTVRAMDLVRYRNFRTFTTPHPVQFSSLAVDPSGEIVCAGTLDSLEVFVWSLQTGKLLDVLPGHEAPISSIVFNPIRPVLASGSWDKTVRIWDIFDNKGAPETLEHGHDVVAVAFRPDGQELVASTLDGHLSFWDVKTFRPAGTIEGRRDVSGGRLSSDRITAKHSAAGKCFSSICYTADGSCLLAGGSSKFVCIYELGQKVLLKQFCISSNLSLDGTQFFLNSKNMTAAGALDLLDDDSASDVEDRVDSSLPGVKKGDLSSRKTRPEIRTKDVQFSPTGRAWAAASTEGLLIYSLDDSFVFDPLDLDVDVTPQSTKAYIAKGEWFTALVMSFRLNEDDLIAEAIESIPKNDIEVIAQAFPLAYVETLLKFVAGQISTSRHLEFYLLWSQHLLNAHGGYLKENSARVLPTLRALQKAVAQHQHTLSRLADENKFSMSYLSSLFSRNVSLEPQPLLAAQGERHSSQESFAEMPNDYTFFYVVVEPSSSSRLWKGIGWRSSRLRI